MIFITYTISATWKIRNETVRLISVYIYGHAYEYDTLRVKLAGTFCLKIILNILWFGYTGDSTSRTIDI